MKKNVIILSLLILPLLVACGGTATTAPDVPATTTAAPLDQTCRYTIPTCALDGETTCVLTTPQIPFEADLEDLELVKAEVRVDADGELVMASQPNTILTVALDFASVRAAVVQLLEPHVDTLVCGSGACVPTGAMPGVILTLTDGVHVFRMEIIGGDTVFVENADDCDDFFFRFDETEAAGIYAIWTAVKTAYEASPSA